MAHIAILPHVNIWGFQAFSSHFDMLKIAEMLFFSEQVYLTRLIWNRNFCQKLIKPTWLNLIHGKSDLQQIHETK